MEWECLPAMTLARSTTQNEPKHQTAQSTPPTTSNPAETTHARHHPSHFDPGSMEHDTDHPAKSEPQHQRQPFNTIADTTPLPEAQNTQKNKQRPTSGVIRRHTQRHHSNHQNETRTQTVSPNIAPDPVITKQPQQPRTSPLKD